MRRRFAAFLTALTLLLALAACGQAPQTPEPGPELTPVPTPELTAAPFTPVPAATPEPSPEPTPEPELVPIDVNTLPTSLSDFLCRFDWGYSDRMDGREFNSADCVDVRANLLAQLVSSSPCVDYSLYPGSPPVFHWADGTADPHEKTDAAGYYAEFDPEQVRWIAQEIFHLSDADYAAVLARCINSGGFYLDKNEEGEDRYFLPVSYLTEPNALVLYTSASSDGNRYVVDYDYLLRPKAYLGSYVAELELREIDGRTYWTLLRHTAEDAAFEPIEAPELFGSFPGSFYLNNGIEGWQTELTIAPDGSFSGSFRYFELLDNGEDCDQVLHYADFSGRFANPIQTGPYTYSVELAELYDADEDLAYTVEEEDGWRVMYRHEDDYGLQNSERFTFYAPGARVYKLPGDFCAWYARTVPLYDTMITLPGWGMMNPYDGCGFACAP